MPLLAGPFIDTPQEPLVRRVSELGCALIFGLPLGPGFSFIDGVVARRWECTPSQIEEAAMRNLLERAAKLPAETVRTATFSGHLVGLARGPSWVSSLLLVPDELRRLFGPQDQIFMAPGHGVLISFPPTMPHGLAADVAIDFERSELYPLMLDPFAIEDGRVVWGGAYDDLDDENVLVD